MLSVRFSFKPDNKFAQLIFGLLSGVFGGISGQWGPPSIIFFLSQNLSPRNIIAYQGILYSLASTGLLFGHLNSGILTEAFLVISCPFIFLCLTGQYFGFLLRKTKGADFFNKFIYLLLFLLGVFFGYGVLFNSVLT